MCNFSLRVPEFFGRQKKKKVKGDSYLVTFSHCVHMMQLWQSHKVHSKNGRNKRISSVVNWHSSTVPLVVPKIAKVTQNSDLWWLLPNNEQPRISQKKISWHIGLEKELIGIHGVASFAFSGLHDYWHGIITKAFPRCRGTAVAALRFNVLKMTRGGILWSHCQVWFNSALYWKESFGQKIFLAVSVLKHHTLFQTSFQ